MNQEDEEKKQSKIQWQPIIELGIVLCTILGSTIPLYLHTDSKIDAINQTHHDMQNLFREMHGRICILESKEGNK